MFSINPIYWFILVSVKRCGAPLFRSNGIIYNQTEFDVGHKLKYTCPTGYLNEGDEFDVCLKEETWSSIIGPKCVGKAYFTLLGRVQPVLNMSVKLVLHY